MITEIESIEHFDELINNPLDQNIKHIIVDFYADWCKPCTKFNPTFKELATTYGKTILFLKLNIDDVEEIAERYEISTIPTFMFFDTGNIKSGYERIIGINKDKIEERLKYFSVKCTDEDEFDF